MIFRPNHNYLKMGKFLKWPQPVLLSYRSVSLVNKLSLSLALLVAATGTNFHISTTPTTQISRPICKTCFVTNASVFSSLRPNDESGRKLFVFSHILLKYSAEMSEAASSSTQTFAEKQAERMKRLRALHSKRNEARQENHKEVIEEDKRKKLPTNWEARKRQAEWLISDEAARKEAEEKGLNYEREKLLNIQAVEADRLDRKKKKKNPDTGFADYEQATTRQYNRLIKGIKPDMEKYEEAREKLGAAFYGDRNTILHGLHEDKKESIDRMVDDLEKQIAKREKYSRRRTHNDDADIDYINERNAKFNSKLERFYGEYTRETKLNLERGTAI